MQDSKPTAFPATFPSDPDLPQPAAERDTGLWMSGQGIDDIGPIVLCHPNRFRSPDKLRCFDNGLQTLAHS